MNVLNAAFRLKLSAMSAGPLGQRGAAAPRTLPPQPPGGANERKTFLAVVRIRVRMYFLSGTATVCSHPRTLCLYPLPSTAYVFQPSPRAVWLQLNV